MEDVGGHPKDKLASCTKYNSSSKRRTILQVYKMKPRLSSLFPHLPSYKYYSLQYRIRDHPKFPREP